MAESLSLQQLKIKEIICESYSVFISGKGGCGKSFILKEIMLELQQKQLNYYITVTTGIAAVNIGGKTVHSFAGICSGTRGSHELISCIQSNAGARERWGKCDVLIIDEVSMMSRDLFERLEIIARAMKKSNKPFGGIQLIFSGDFTQLKPVTTVNLSDEELFCFRSLMWNACIDFSVFLTENFRQDEPQLLRILDEFRACDLSNDTINFVKTALSRPLNVHPFDVVRLFPHKDKVREENDKFLDMLPGEQHVFHATDTGNSHALHKCPAQKNLILKLNARVVLIKNLSDKLVNGARGYILRFIGDAPLIQFDNGELQCIKEEILVVEDDCGNVLGTRKQIPLDLAYCMTIHKSQGMEFDCLEVDLSDVFDPGQAYVAVSRAKTLNGLRILGVHPALPKTSELVEQFYKTEVVNVEDVDRKQLLKEKKKRSTNTLQFVDIKSCKKVLLLILVNLCFQKNMNLV